MASITKMMTFYTSLKLLDKFGMDPEETHVTVSRAATRIPGTSADLREGDILSV